MTKFVDDSWMIDSKHLAPPKNLLSLHKVGDLKSLLKPGVVIGSDTTLTETLQQMGAQNQQFAVVVD